MPSDYVWEPTAERIESARVTRFMRRHGIADPRELVRRSAADIQWFWTACLEDLGVEWTTPYEKLVDLARPFPWTRWFLGGRLNLVANVLDRHLKSGRGADPAVIGEGDDGEVRCWTRQELADETCRAANALRDLGVGRGDAVGIYMPMVPEIVAAFLACMKIGAAAVPIFSGFGPGAVAARLRDAQAKVLFTADGARRRGKAVPLKGGADAALRDAPSVRHAVVLRRTGEGPVPWTPYRDLWWHDVVGRQPARAATDPVDAEHTAMILYTSGTTGRPKGCVHTHAGALAQIAKEHAYAFDVRPDDVFFWLTDIGWMMGPWEIVGAGFHGACLVLFEGAPVHPTPARLWEVVERHRVTTLGISPTAVRLLAAQGDDWTKRHDLSSLRLLGSTGEPWDPESYGWLFDRIGGRRCPIINISGGTEIVGCLLSPLPVVPLKPCSLGMPGLGMDVDVVDDAGKPIRGGIGHLVCRKPAPSMTKGFLGDPERYLDTYFSRFPGVWYHGDWAKVDADGQWFLYGRSDDTIKVAGKRVGPAEVEAALVEHPDVAEAAAIGVPHELKGEAIVCFVTLKPGRAPSEPLRGELMERVAAHLGKALKPEAVKFAAALPKTRSAKIVRGAIRRAHLGEPPGDVSSVENPEALEDVRRAT